MFSGLVIIVNLQTGAYVTDRFIYVSQVCKPVNRYTFALRCVNLLAKPVFVIFQVKWRFSVMRPLVESWVTYSGGFIVVR